jgi:hypothetical protein
MLPQIKSYAGARKEALLIHITHVLLVHFGEHLVGIMPLHISTFAEKL